MKKYKKEAEEVERYRNHIPDELEQLLEEFMDTYEKTGEIIDCGESLKKTPTKTDT